MQPMKPATAQMQADAMLADDRERRRIAALDDSALRQCLAAIEQRAKAEAAPYIAALVELEAMRPAAPMVIPATGFDRFEERARLAHATDALGDRFGRVPYSRADQARNALLAAFEPCSAPVRRDLRDALEGAPDAVLERAARLLKSG